MFNIQFDAKGDFCFFSSDDIYKKIYLHVPLSLLFESSDECFTWLVSGVELECQCRLLGSGMYF